MLFGVPRGRLLPGVLIATPLAALLLLAAFTVTALAQPVEPGISGNVTDSSGSPMGNCDVRLYDEDRTQVAATATDGLGDYSFTGLSPGVFYVHFHPNDGLHVGQWYSGVNTLDWARANQVTVQAEAVTSGVDARLVMGASVSGTVLSSAGGSVYPCEVLLSIILWDGHSWNAVPTRTVAVNSAGYYRIRGLDTAYYLLKFVPGDDYHFEEWYKDKANMSEADRVQLVAGKSKTINPTLAAGGWISGRVSSTAGYDLRDYVVTPYLYDESTDSWSPYTDVPDMLTGEDGNYLLKRLPAGVYKLQFSPPEGDKTHFPEYYNNRQSLEKADAVYVYGRRTTSKINAELTKGSSISGRVVRASDKAPVKDCPVEVHSYQNDRWTKVGEGRTDATGNYSIMLLRAGAYRVNFATTHPLLVPQWFRGKPSIAQANDVVLRTGEDRLGVDAGLAWREGAGLPRHAVDSAQFSDYGALLGRLDKSFLLLSFDELRDAGLLERFDSVFLNCSNDNRGGGMSPAALRSYVEKGGELFLSDFAGRAALDACWPGLVHFTSYPEQGSSQKVTAAITDAGMRSYMGRSTAQVNYDHGGWAVISRVADGVRIHLRADVRTEYMSVLEDSPLSISFSYGAGEVHYSTFHESVQGDFGGRHVSYFLDSSASAGTSWYLAEGSSDGGNETWVLIQNPGRTAADVLIDYMTSGGAVDGPHLVVPGESRASVRVRETVADIQVSTKVASNLPIVVERSMYGNNGNWATNSIGATTPAGRWYLAEGSTNGGMETWVLVQNPCAEEQTVALTYMTPSGAVAGPEVILSPYSRMSFHAADTVPGQWDVSTMVTSSGNVIAERAVYGNGRTWGTNSIGASAGASSWYLAEGSTNGGMETWVLVQNPNSTEASVALNYMTSSGPVAGPSVKLPANSRKSFAVSDTVRDNWEVSTVVKSNVPVIVERSVYGNGRTWGTDSIGMKAPGYGCLLAEGSTNGGMETWVLVQNPNESAARVTLTYLTDRGPVRGPTATVPAKSRKTFAVSDTVPDTWDVSTMVSSDRPVVVERSMFGNGRAWATDSIGRSQ